MDVVKAHTRPRTFSYSALSDPLGAGYSREMSMRFAIKDGDVVVFMPSFGTALVTPIPTTISSSATSTSVVDTPVCLEGDEREVESPGCAYIAPPFVVPGVGTLKIMKLGADQVSQNATIEGKKVILQGSVFQAVFEVQTPAQIPVACTPDPVPQYPGGVGMFIPSQLQCKQA